MKKYTLLLDDSENVYKLCNIFNFINSCEGEIREFLVLYLEHEEEWPRMVADKQVWNVNGNFLSKNYYCDQYHDGVERLCPMCNVMKNYYGGQQQATITVNKKSSIVLVNRQHRYRDALITYILINSIIWFLTNKNQSYILPNIMLNARKCGTLLRQVYFINSSTKLSELKKIDEMAIILQFIIIGQFMEKNKILMRHATPDYFYVKGEPVLIEFSNGEKVTSNQKLLFDFNNNIRQIEFNNRIVGVEVDRDGIGFKPLLKLLLEMLPTSDFTELVWKTLDYYQYEEEIADRLYGDLGIQQ